MSNNSDYPLVTIIIPVYNGENYLKEAIDSALEQTYPNVEIIVVNDGSNDNGATYRIATSYGKKIKYYEKENGGVSTALNYGISVMNGEYFSWLSHDDMYCKDKIKRQIVELKKTNNMEQVVYSNYYEMLMPGKNISLCHVLDSDTFLSRYAQSGLIATVLGLISGCSLLIPKTYFDKYGFFDESKRAVQDYMKWFEMFKDKRLLYLNEPLIITRNHSDQVTWNYSGVQNENVWLYEWIADQLQYKLDDTLPISKYELLSMILFSLGIRNLEVAFESFEKYLREEKEPANIYSSQKKLADYLGTKVVLFGMGQRGKFLYDSLRYRGVNVFLFADNDKAKWGSRYRETVCINPSDIPKEATVIITIYKCNGLIEELRYKGYKSVMCLEDISDKMYETPIDKKKYFGDKY